MGQLNRSNSLIGKNDYNSRSIILVKLFTEISQTDYQKVKDVAMILSG